MKNEPDEGRAFMAFVLNAHGNQKIYIKTTLRLSREEEEAYDEGN